VLGVLQPGYNGRIGVGPDPTVQIGVALRLGVANITRLDWQSARSIKI
jgi:hypothetical protein